MAEYLPFLFLILSLVLCTIDVECKSTSGETNNRKNSFLGQGQAELASILDGLAGGKFQLYEPNEYNVNFRPPCSSTPSEQCPTLIKLSLKRAKVKSLNTTKDGEAAKIEAILGMEYQDSRLKFSVPSEYKRSYVRARYGALDPLNIWHPDLRINGDLGVFNDGNDALTFYNSEGQIYDQKPIGVNAKFVGYKENVLIFSMQILSKWDFVEDIRLEWGEEMHRISFNSDSNQKVQSMDGKGEFEVKLLGEVVGPCEKKEIGNYGIMGEHETSCIELQIQFRPLEGGNTA